MFWSPQESAADSALQPVSELNENGYIDVRFAPTKITRNATRWNPAVPRSPHPHLAAVIAAFAVVYVVWGSTYLAIRYAVETIPPFMMAILSDEIARDATARLTFLFGTHAEGLRANDTMNLTADRE